MPTPPLATTGTDTASAIVAGERQVVAVAGAVAVHRCDQDFARAEFRQPDRMLDRVDAGFAAAAVGEDFPAVADPPRIDAGDAALAAEAFGDVGDDFGPGDRGGIDRDLVGARQQQRARIVGAAYPAADGQRHEADLRGAAHHVEDRVAPLVARADVEEAELVGAGRVIGARLFHRIAGIAADRRN